MVLTDGVPSYTYSNIIHAVGIKTELNIPQCVMPPTGREGGICGAELVSYMANTDLSDSIPGVNNVIVHTIGLELVEP